MKTKRKKLVDKLLETSEVIAELRAENAQLKEMLETILLVNNNVLIGVQNDITSLKDIDMQLGKSIAFRTTLQNVGDIIVKLLDYAKAISTNHKSLLNLKGSIEELDGIVADALRLQIEEDKALVAAPQSVKKPKNDLN